MACYQPNYGVGSDFGPVTLHPHRDKALAADGDYLELPCGRCQACRTRRVRDTAVRSHHEYLTTHKPSSVDGSSIPVGCMITLTYRPEDLPPNASLNKRHWTLFRKRLRERFGPFRFLHCGEYGDAKQRPHYHALLFGLDFKHDRQVLYRKENRIVWVSDSLTETWGHGFTSIAPLNFATASYTAGYVFKKLSKDNWARDEPGRWVWRPTEENEQPKLPPLESPFTPNRPVRVPHDAKGRFEFVPDRVQEYVTMSNRPGLGRKYFEKHWRDIYPRDLVFVGKKKFRPPRRYDQWLKDEEPRMWERVMELREEYTARKGPTTDRELQALKVITLQKAKGKSRHENLLDL